MGTYKPRKGSARPKRGKAGKAGYRKKTAYGGKKLPAPNKRRPAQSRVARNVFPEKVVTTLDYWESFAMRQEGRLNLNKI